MPKIPRSILKTFFEKGDKPAQVHFEALIDSLVHVTDDRGLIGLRNYDTSLSYVVGDTVLHNGNLYQCNTATAGPMNTAHWNLLQALGSVIYMGTWSAASNAPVLSDTTGIKGNYFVVTDGASRNLGSGSLEWNAGDWVIHNGQQWEKVDNTDDKIAANIAFTPDGDIAATNLQDAVAEVRNDTNTKLGGKTDKVNPAVSGNFAGLSTSGNLTDSSFSPEDFLYKENTIPYTPLTDFHPATKKYVDDAAAAIDMSAKADKISGGGTDGMIAGLDADGNIANTGKQLADFLDKTNANAYSPAHDFNPATKKYVDDSTAALGVSNKADKVTGGTSDGKFAGLNASGNITDSGKSPSDYLDKTNTTAFTPSASYHPATKKYVDDTATALGISNKADKVTGGTSNGKFAGLNASGNITDSGKSPSDYLDKTNTTVYTPGADYHPSTKKYVDDRTQRLIVNYTFPTSFQTGSSSFAAIDLLNIVPAVADVFPSATRIKAKLRVEYQTDTNTTGQAALFNFSDYTTGTIREVPGSLIDLPNTQAWRQVVSAEFEVTGGKNYKVIFKALAGNKVKIQGATLILKYE